MLCPHRFHHAICCEVRMMATPAPKEKKIKMGARAKEGRSGYKTQAKWRTAREQHRNRVRGSLKTMVGVGAGRPPGRSGIIALRAPISTPGRPSIFLLVNRHDFLICGQNLHQFPFNFLLFSVLQSANLKRSNSTISPFFQTATTFFYHTKKKAK